jgi:hypothetical protein
MTNDAGDMPIPTPITTNGWKPASLFDPALYAGGEEFLVWLIHPDLDGFAQVAQWWPDLDIDGNSIGASRFQGEWRHTGGLEHLEPVAFRPMPEGPDLERLVQIAAVHALEA